MKSVRLQVEGVLYDHAGLKSLKQTDNTDDTQGLMIGSYRNWLQKGEGKYEHSTQSQTPCAHLFDRRNGSLVLFLQNHR